MWREMSGAPCSAEPGARLLVWGQASPLPAARFLVAVGSRISPVLHEPLQDVLLVCPVLLLSSYFSFALHFPVVGQQRCNAFAAFACNLVPGERMDDNGGGSFSCCQLCALSLASEVVLERSHHVLPAGPSACLSHGLAASSCTQLFPCPGRGNWGARLRLQRCAWRAAACRKVWQQRWQPRAAVAGSLLIVSAASVCHQQG